jgi:predicted TIM-barrel fold metal-dependent hydrolase
MATIEMGSDWVRELLRKLAKSYGQSPRAYKQDPVEAFRRHVWVSPFQEEDLRGMADLVGVDRMIMGSDFPHAEGIAEPAAYVHELKGFSAREVRMIMRENALLLSERRPD